MKLRTGRSSACLVRALHLYRVFCFHAGWFTAHFGVSCEPHCGNRSSPMPKITFPKALVTARFVARHLKTSRRWLKVPLDGAEMHANGLSGAGNYSNRDWGATTLIANYPYELRGWPRNFAARAVTNRRVKLTSMDLAGQVHPTARDAWRGFTYGRSGRTLGWRSTRFRSHLRCYASASRPR